MGYDIEVVDFEVENGLISNEDYIDTLYMSYNWYDLREIWSVCADMHGRQGTDVQERLEAALKKLDEMRVTTKTFTSEQNPSWGWGVDMSQEDRLGVFRYHLERFLDAARKHPNAYFLNEEADSITIGEKVYKIPSRHSLRGSE